ncbi:uncharacterized protein LOC111343460 [Stylophora pistillata]|uniref:uncharacterized protein LOC111343460 n=1 Tax=Stylophora pistillata TaxID=50429 RepID=UPI000C04B1D8|nr:uncharacterized protein LOC111343460 [Stylophora pistillata]
MPRRIRRNLSLTVKGTNPFKSRRDKEINTAEVNFNSFNQRASGKKEKQKEEATVKHKSSPKLPTLTKPRTLSQEDSKDIQNLFQVRYFDGPFHEVRKSKNSSHRSEASKTSRDTSSSIQVNHDDRVKKTDHRFKNKRSVRPLLQATVRRSLRVNLRGKDGLKSQEIQLHCTPNNKDIYPPCFQNDSRVENILFKISSLKTSDEDTQPIFHLPRVNKTDTPSGNLKDDSVFSVFNLKGIKSSPIYSRFRNSWVPHRDKYYMNNSAFFQALSQQPAVLLRQPSPVAGVQMTLKDHEDSVLAAIQAVRETNIKTPTAETKLTQQRKKLVVTLPQIC